MEQIDNPRCTDSVKPNARKYYNDNPGYLRSLMQQAGIGTRKAAELIGITDRELRHMLNGIKPHPYGVQYCLEALADFPGVPKTPSANTDSESPQSDS